MATVFKLIIEDDEGKTTVYPLGEGAVSIGRKEGNTIRLMERNVSRRHARLNRGNGAVYIEDLDSYNGVRINGERIAGRYQVKEGDLVEIGDYHLALQRTEVVEDDAPTGESAAPRRHPDGQPQPGTLPEMRMPAELSSGGNRDTLVDQPSPSPAPVATAQTVERAGLASPVMPQNPPLVKPPPSGGAPGGDLPPFPGPGGLPAPKAPMYGEATQATEALDRKPTGKLGVGPAYKSPVPRLVCLSTSYAGKEFSLTRPELIIGRVEDNDIVIEHRSVSRNHAKILFDGRTHKIIDLQSANGILVNGEEYAMTDLRKGDLIELGHVRFRFVPADEPFVPNDEEAREMREAGVEPPSAPAEAPARDSLAAALSAPPVPSNGSDVAAAVPAYDPSTAATVTDTPLDALGMEDLAAPKVEPAAPRAPKAIEDLRPTEVDAGSGQASARNGRSAAAALSATVPDTSVLEPAARADTQRYDSVAPAPAEGGPKKGLLVVIAALLLTAVVLSMLVFMDGSSGERQVGLQKAFAAKNWGKVVSLYEDDPTDFSDPKGAMKLYKQALAKQQMGATAPMEEDPAPLETPEPPPEPEPAPEPEPEPEEVEDLPAGDADPKPRSKPRPRARRPRPRPRPAATGAGAAELAAQGKRALLQGDLSEAKKHLEACIDKDPRYAACHRALGVLYAQRDDTERALRHYRRYVELRPNALDAERVRTMIKKAEEAGAGAPP